MKYYTYVLRSVKNGDIYIGNTKDINNRLTLHNTGKVKSTKAYRPWELLKQEEFETRSEAFRREHFFKSHQQKEVLKKEYGLVAKTVNATVCKTVIRRFDSGLGLKATVVGLSRFARSRAAGQNRYTRVQFPPRP